MMRIASPRVPPLAFDGRSGTIHLPVFLMKKLSGKAFILLVGGVSILVLVILVASLGSLAFKPAIPFAYDLGNAQRTVPLPEQPPSWNSLIYVAIFLGTVLAVIFFLLPPDLRKKFLRGLLILVVAGILIFLVLTRTALGPSVAQPTQGGGGPAITIPAEATAAPESKITPVVYHPPALVPWISYVISLGVLLMVAGVVAWVLLRRERERAPFEELGAIAQTALQDLDEGKDWGDTVLNCYSRMTRAVEGWRGIRRKEGMTPAEFARYLVTAGLPGEAVRGLTGLFERVRYGGRRPAPDDVREASACLAAIQAFCQAAK